MTKAKKLGCGALIISPFYNGDDASLRAQLPPPSILLFQRGYGAPTFPGYFGGPGGIFESAKDSGPAEAAKRETEEEGNILFQPEDSPFYQGSMADRDLVYYLGQWSALPGGIRHNDGEAIGHMWLSGEKALAMDLSFHYRQAILKLVEQKIL